MTETVQDYLKAIWMLDRSRSNVTTSALAERLGVTAASATAMIKRLASVGLVRHEPYHGVSLTEAGTKAALEVIRHHRLLELYLMQALGLSWDEVHAEAERLEHHLSEALEARIDAALGHPTHDPHGDPIPTRRARAGRRGRPPAERARAGAEAVIRRVPDGDPGLLRYLAELGFVPDERVVMLGTRALRRPADGRGGRRAPCHLARARRAHPHRRVRVNPPPVAHRSARRRAPRRAEGTGGGAALAGRARRGSARAVAVPRPGLHRRDRLRRPGQLRDQHRRGLEVRLPAAVGHPGLEPDGDADPDDERQARHRHGRQPRRGQRASASRARCASSSGCRPRRSRWPPTWPSSSARRSASTCSSACRCCPPACSPASSRSRSWPPSCAACATSRPSSRRSSGIIVAGFAFQIFHANPDGSAVVKGLLTPQLRRHRERAAGGRHPRRDGHAARHLPALRRSRSAACRRGRRRAPAHLPLRADRRRDRHDDRRARQHGDADHGGGRLPLARPDRDRRHRRGLSRARDDRRRPRRRRSSASRCSPRASRPRASARSPGRS